ncbi:MAG: peptidoglycan DD-metalloendopeptidase family protein [Microcoleus sp. SIO2G3]|nr:peptidoglycan DD-metalloendopeptidase family protein [Microcoleus sp. SIO2G3]
MRKVAFSRFLSTSLVGLISCSGVVWVSPSVLTQPANNSVAARNRSNAAYMWPAQGHITQGFSATHEGLDIAGASGTPIVAAASGEVTFASWGDDGLGNSIELQHSDGSVTVYGHNKRLLVRKGQPVSQGQIIAEMGTTGNSTGSHLHFEVYPDGFQAADPFPRLPPLVSGRIPPLPPQPVANAPEPTASKPTTPARVQPQPPLERNRQAAQSPIIARGTTGNNTAPPLDFEVYSEGRETNKPNLVVPPVVGRETPRIQSEPVVPEPLNFAPSRSMSVGAGGVCSDEAVIEGETANFLVNVCLENGRLFYLGQSKQNPSVIVRLPARSTSDGWYRADNGSYSYYVSATQVKVLQNGRQIRSERLYK